MSTWTKKLLFELCILTMALAERRSLQEDLLSANGASLNTLSEMPLDKLLMLRNSISETNEPLQRKSDTILWPEESFEKGEALALRLEDPTKRTGYGGVLKKKSSKLNTIFMLSVTTLAFLAFGGYLLCLIVQAIKAKSGDGAALAGNGGASILISSAIKKKKKRPRDDRRKRAAYIPTVENADKLYETLIALCEGFAKWEKHID